MFKHNFWCMFFDHDWVSYRPVNAKQGDTTWYCKRKGCSAREYSA